YRFPLAIYQPYSGRDLEVSVRLKPVAGQVDEAGGIAVRLQTPDNYYIARANALEDNVRFFRPKATGSPSPLTASSLSPRRTEPFPMPGRWRCGPRPTVSPTSIRSRSHH